MLRAARVMSPGAGLPDLRSRRFVELVLTRTIESNAMRSGYDEKLVWRGNECGLVGMTPPLVVNEWFRSKARKNPASVRRAGFT
jgi:hypothetical protein